MLNLTVGDFLDDSLDDVLETCERLYVVGDGDLTLYVGQSQSPIDRILEHLGLAGRNRGWPSRLGQLILDNAPASHAWTVRLLAVDDCEAAIREVFPAYVRWDVDLAERAMIHTLRPCLNVIHNCQGTPLPAKYLHARPTDSSARYLAV